MLSSFPLCIKGWLEIRDSGYDERSTEEWKSSGIISNRNWQSKFCILMENDSKFYIFNDESNAERLTIPNHILQCRLDNELNVYHMSDSFNDNVSVSSSRNQESDRYVSNTSLSHMNSSKSSRRGGFFRNGSRLFRNSKTNRKLSDQTNNSITYENNQSMKSVSSLKRSLSLTRINSKKSEEKSDSKLSYEKSKNNVFSQSTGDLTLSAKSTSVIRHNLTKNSTISEIHPSLISERPFCFSLTSLSDEINMGSNFESRLSNSMNKRRLFAASSNLERQCWMKRLQLTMKPNIENENRYYNSLKLTIFESKQLPSITRRYYCEVSLDKNLGARTTSKTATNDACVFWAEDLVLNNLPSFKTVMISLYKEALSGKDSKKKRKKPQNHCIGQLNLNLAMLNNKNELQSWFNLKSTDFLSDLSLNNIIQLRIKVRYQALKVLRNDIYLPLYRIATEHYLDLIHLLENNIPIKLKEEIANCLVNIHERNGTILTFLIDLISEEISDFDNSSMTLRANTIVTKIIESHMKLVGFQYIHNMLYAFVRDVMYKDITIEVDYSRYDVDDSKQKLLFDNQHSLMLYLKQILFKIYQSSNQEFPKQLKSVFVGWRKKLMSQVSKEVDLEKVDYHCDVIVSGCIFLRLLCPSILSPHLFGLVPFFSEKSTVQRTLTLMAKSLQSLANLSKFGEKEKFMTFLNSSFEEEIPRMRDFLRSISSFIDCDEDTEAVNKDIHYYGTTVDLQVEMARLHKCLVSDGVKESINNAPKIQNMLKLPNIMHQISHQLISFNVSQSTSSFYPTKKSKNALLLDQRKISSGQLLNIVTIDLGKSDLSPTRSGNPVLQFPLLDTVSEHSLHKTVCQKKTIERNISFNKPAKNEHNSYSTKPQYLPRRSVGNVRESDVEVVKEVNYKGSQSLFCNLISNESQSKSSIPKHFQSNKLKVPPKTYQTFLKGSATKIVSDSIYDKVNDSLYIKKSGQPKLSNICNEEFYRENPLYEFGNVTTIQKLPPSSNDYYYKTIDKYFDIRNQVNLFEQNVKQEVAANEHKEYLQKLRQELDSTRKQIQTDQMSDLKQLKSMVLFNKNSVISRETSRCNNTSSQKLDTSSSVMVDVLDDVINSITTDGAGLDEVQENLRKYSKKGKSFAKHEGAPFIFKRESSMDILFNSSNSQHNTHMAPIDISDYPLSIIDSSSNVGRSISSSNCSSLRSELI